MSHTHSVVGTFDSSESEIRRTFQRQVLASVWDACTARAAALFAAHAERRRIRRAVAELSGLSDRMLKDIGVARHDIGRIARCGRNATDIRA